MEDLSPVFIGHESPQQSHDAFASAVADVFVSLFFIGHESPLQHEQSHDVFASPAAVVWVFASLFFIGHESPQQVHEAFAFGVSLPLVVYANATIAIARMSKVANVMTNLRFISISPNL